MTLKIVVFAVLALCIGGHIWMVVSVVTAWAWRRVLNAIGWERTYRAVVSVFPPDLVEDVYEQYRPEPPRLDFSFGWISAELAWQWEFNRIFFLLATLVALLAMYSLTKFPARKIVYRCRGIVGEAMVDGSYMLEGQSIPKFQVPLYRNELFTSTFIGYGLRVGNYLALPLHVYAVSEGRLLAGKVMIRGAFIKSRVANDLCYVNMTESDWSLIGASKISSYPEEIGKGSVMVSCCGRDGQSTGMLKRMTDCGMMEYMGSTKPGYSGAAYFVGTKVYGMHCGVHGERTNVGISIVAIRGEIEHLSVGEASTSSYSQEEVLGNFIKKPQFYDTSFYKKLSAQRWKKDDWNEEIDYTENIDWGENAKVDAGVDYGKLFEDIRSREELIALQNMITRCLAEDKFSSPPSGARTYRGQAADGEPEMRMPKPTWAAACESLSYNVEKLEKDLQLIRESVAENLASQENRIKALEEALEKASETRKEEKEEKEKEEKLKPEEPAEFKCADCGRVLKSEIGRRMHHLQVHQIAVGESAIKSDFVNATKKSGRPAFLGKTYQKKSWPASSQNSRYKGESSRYLSPQRNQQSMENLMKKLVQGLEDLRKDIVGQNSASVQN